MRRMVCVFLTVLMLMGLTGIDGIGQPALAAAPSVVKIAAAGLIRWRSSPTAASTLGETTNTGSWATGTGVPESTKLCPR